MNTRVESESSNIMHRKITRDDIEAAFIFLLGRSAGEIGLAHYQRIGVDAGWSLQTLRDVITSSPEYQASKETILNIDGFQIAVDPNEVDFGRHIVTHNGGYEEHNLRLIRATLKRGSVFVDIGANIGLLSLTARQAVGDDGKVICFEPMASNAAHLIKSIILNDFRNMIVHPVALSDGARSLFLEGSSNGTLMTSGTPSRRMTTVRGDAFLKHEERVDFIKIDIEGHEPFALRGLSNTLRKHHPLIMCEFNPFTLDKGLQITPESFADQVFAMTTEVQVIDYDGEINFLHETTALIDYWRLRNREYADAGRIANGMLHFDLLFRAQPS